MFILRQKVVVRVSNDTESFENTIDQVLAVHTRSDNIWKRCHTLSRNVTWWISGSRDKWWHMVTIGDIWWQFAWLLVTSRDIAWHCVNIKGPGSAVLEESLKKLKFVKNIASRCVTWRHVPSYYKLLAITVLVDFKLAKFEKK